MLQAKIQRLFPARSCTKPSMSRVSKKLCELPPIIRTIKWDEIKAAMSCNLVGKGAFAKCYIAQMGSMKVCIKILYAGCKYVAKGD